MKHNMLFPPKLFPDHDIGYMPAMSPPLPYLCWIRAILGTNTILQGENEIDNLAMAELIAKAVGRPLNYELVSFYAARPGNDHSYHLNGYKLKNMGFTMPVSFEDSLYKTIEWTANNPKWLEE